MKDAVKTKMITGAMMVALLAAGCKEKASPPMSHPPAAVTVNQAVQREVIDWDQYPGRLEAVDMVELRSRVSGYLQSVHFTDGAEVKKGDLLFTIDPRPYQADLDRAEANLKQAQTKLDLAKNELDRAERLFKSKAISEEEADAKSKAKREAEAALDSAKASVEAARLNVEYTHITAPISGRIGRKLITEGNLVNSSQGQSTLLTTIVSQDPVFCYFDADERSFLKYQKLFREGKQENLRDGKVVCELELENESGYPHKGVLDFVDNRVDTATGTVHIRGVFSNPGPHRLLQPGYFARVRVPGSDKYNALLVASEAIGTDQGQKFVYIVNDKDEVEYRTVKLGPVVDGLQVIREGIKAQDWVIVNGLMSARPGAKVNPTRAAAGVAETKMDSKK